MGKRSSEAAPGRVQAPRRRGQPHRIPPLGVAGAVAAAAVLAASFVTPRLLEDGGAPVRPGSGPVRTGDGPDLGTAVAFAERDAVTGRPISARTLAGRRTLLFFSEGVMCQACFEQIRDLERVGDELEGRGIRLVSITPDSPELLREAIEQYGIRTPMIADDDRDMSAAFDTLGRGMHADAPGHAFVLLDEAGRVVWQRDYWLEPDRTMYVDPATLLADLPLTQPTRKD